MIRSQHLVKLAVILGFCSSALASSMTPRHVCYALQPYIEKQLYTSTSPAYSYVLAPHQYLHQGQVVGAIIGVYWHGYSCYYSYGRNNLNFATTPTPQTLFEIGSLSKLFTATLITAESQRYHFNLNDPVKNWLPTQQGFNLNQYEQTLNFTELATHTAGLLANPNNIYARYPLSTQNYSEKSFVNLINNNTGTAGHYHYSNTGYALLGQIATSLAGYSYRNYGNAIQQDIALPLHMYHTNTEPLIDSDTYATGYTNCIGSPQCQQAIFPIAAWPTHTPLDGSIALHANAIDLMTYIKTALKQNLTAPRAIRNAISATLIAPKPYIAIPNWPHHVQAFAWEEQLPAKNRDLQFTKNGSTFGYSSIIALDPAKDLGLVILTNTNNAYNCQFYNNESYRIGLGILNSLPKFENKLI